IRTQMLAKLTGIEDRVWIRIVGFNRVFAIADEDMERARADKTSAVHFLRFELSPNMVAALKNGADVAMGVDHPEYQAAVESIDSASRQALTADLD
nr:DUF3501 family protein [Burkholderiales bacterium]